MKRSLLFTLFLLAIKFSTAQFNDSTHHYIKYAAVGIVNKTNNSRSFIANNALAFSMRKKKLELNSSNSWVYGEQNRAKTNNDFASILNLDILKKQQRLYYWALLTYTSSYSLRINKQFQGGAGIGYTIADNDRLHLIISDGILYETSDLELSQQGRDKYQTIRNSLRIKYKWLMGSIVTLEGATYWQPSLSNSSDYILQSATSLSIRLKKWLSITSTVIYNRFSRTDRENLLVNFGLVADRYF